MKDNRVRRTVALRAKIETQCVCFDLELVLEVESSIGMTYRSTVNTSRNRICTKGGRFELSDPASSINKSFARE